MKITNPFRRKETKAESIMRTVKPHDRFDIAYKAAVSITPDDENDDVGVFLLSDKSILIYHSAENKFTI